MIKEVILYFIASFITLINLVFIYGHLTKQSSLNIKKNIFLLILGTIIITAIYKYELINTKTIFSLTFLFFLYLRIYKNNLNFTFFYTFIIWLLGMILDIIFISLFSLILYKIKVNNDMYFMYFATLALQLLYNKMSKIKRIQNFITNCYEKINKIEKTAWLYLLLCMSVIILGIVAFQNFNNVDVEMLVVLTCMLIILLCIFYIHLRYKSKIYDETIHLLLENNLFYSDLNNQNREFKHNIIHKLNGIKTIANDESISLINDLINEYNLSSVPNKELDNLPVGINGLIYRKIYEKKNKNLNLAVANNLKNNLFDLLVPRNYNRLCEVIGICLDNALMATLKTKEKILHIGINEDHGFIYLRIINTFSSELEIDKLGTKDYTTKGKGHGIGLSSILVKKDVKIKTSIINNLFENRICVRKKKAL